MKNNNDRSGFASVAVAIVAFAGLALGAGDARAQSACDLIYPEYYCSILPPPGGEHPCDPGFKPSCLCDCLVQPVCVPESCDPNCVAWDCNDIHIACQPTFPLNPFWAGSLCGVNCTPGCWVCTAGQLWCPDPANQAVILKYGIETIDCAPLGTIPLYWTVCPTGTDPNVTYEPLSTGPTGPEWCLRARANNGPGRITVIGLYDGHCVVANVESQLIVPEYCEGDTNLDGVVDTLDLLAVEAGWGKCAPGDPCETCCPGDVNGDGFVDTLDLLVVLAAWGPCQ